MAEEHTTHHYLQARHARLNRPLTTVQSGVRSSQTIISRRKGRLRTNTSSVRVIGPPRSTKDHSSSTGHAPTEPPAATIPASSSPPPSFCEHPSDDYANLSSDPWTLDADIDPLQHNPSVGAQGNNAVTKRVRISAFDQWNIYRQKYLDEILSLEGAFSSSCTSCSKDLFTATTKAFRCEDCFLIPTLCEECVATHHRRTPFHRVKMWDSGFWKNHGLADLRLTYHLGHDGFPCDRPARREPLTVMDTNGFHKVIVIFCGCSTDIDGISSQIQLLRARLFPATTENPRTAFTFASLDLLTHLSTQGKISAYHFYTSMRAMTDCMDLQSWPNRYDELSRVIRRYKHILMLKRAGRGHVADRVSSTAHGQLALECPACPHPGKNMPIDWQEKFSTKPHLHAQYVAIDANFRLKRKERGFNSSGTLGPGWAYFVDPTSFARELQRVSRAQQIQEKSTCESSFAAIERANSRMNNGFAVTGVVGVIDSRHGILLPNAIADLQRGERYVNTDYTFLSASRHLGARLLKTSYDIVCQWSRNFSKRCDAFPRELRKHLDNMEINYGIPKFHLPAHGPRCWSLYSLNYLDGWARVDGEGIERFWADANALATSTREMASGTRHDSLDFHWGESNFRKIVGLGAALANRLRNAVKGRRRRVQELSELSASLPPDLIAKWSKQIKDWQTNPVGLLDPYQEITPDYSMKDVERELEGPSDTLDADGDGEPILTETGFLIRALEIEEQQCTLHALRSTTSTAKKKTSVLVRLAELESAVRRRIVKWLPMQAIYMPRAVRFREGRKAAGPFHHQSAAVDNGDAFTLSGADDDEAEVEGGEYVDVEDYGAVGPDVDGFELLLPSALDSINNSLASTSLSAKEGEVRKAQLNNILQELRRLLRIKASVYMDKKRHAIGQKGNTRSATKLSGYARRVDSTADRYRSTRELLHRLDPHGDWKNKFKVLEKQDVRPMDMNVSDMETEEEQEEDLVGEAARRARPKKKRIRPQSRREYSWIWLVPKARKGVGSEEEAMSEEEAGEAYRVEYGKAHARARRYIEEEELAVEEMRRTIQYLKWKASWWTSIDCSARNERVFKGCCAYGEKQAFNQMELARKFESTWRHILEQLDLHVDW